MVSYVSVLLYGVGGIMVAGMVLLVAFQEKLVYVPVLPGLPKSNALTPSRFRLTYEDFWLTSSDGVRLHSWFIKLFSDCRDIAHRLEMIQVMLQRLHCNVFMLSYRGYGVSDGYPSQHGIIRDAQIAALILENTFTSILDLAGVVLPFLKWFIGKSTSKGPKVLNFLVRSPWNTIDVVGEIKQPILFLSGLQDEMVPPIHMQLLYAKADMHNKDCLFVEFPNGMHIDTWLTGGDRNWRNIQLFLEQHGKVKRGEHEPSERNENLSGHLSFNA